ncbi:MAG: hypothetical protein WC917_04340 [Bacilli bacterium]|jgi:DUF438 domain-containing protein
MEDERIIEIENMLVDSGADPSKIDDIMDLFKEKDNISINGISKDNEETEDSLKLKIMNEKDWRKRASMSAMIISKSLE